MLGVCGKMYAGVTLPPVSIIFLRYPVSAGAVTGSGGHQCSAVQCSAVQCSAVQCSAITGEVWVTNQR
jgi:hypothetical protein